MIQDKYVPSKSDNQEKDLKNQDNMRLNDYEIVEQYLSLDITNLSSLSRINQKTQNKIKMVQSPPKFAKIEVPLFKKHSSVFHNFQKHLIAIIKKFIYFSKQKLNNYPSGQVSYMLWIAFLECNVGNKKILTLMLGSYQAQRMLNQSSSKQFEAFRTIFNQFSIEEIQQAQNLLRISLVAQARTLSKYFLEANSKIRNFEDFFQYFRSFIAQLEDGPLSRRVIKPRKTQNQILHVTKEQIK